MVSNPLYSAIKLDMSSMDCSDEEEMGKTAHHNITVELKEVKIATIHKQIRRHFI